MPDVLLISPDDMEPLTRALRKWASDLGYTVVAHDSHSWRSLRADVTRASVEAALSAQPAAVFFYGHGEADCWLSAGSRILDDANATHLANKLVFSVACDSARELGHAAVTSGARAYVGYDFTFTTTLGDEYEPSFRRAANAPQITILRQGVRCDQAVAVARLMYIESSDAIVYSPRRSDYDGMFAAGWLRSDGFALRVIGDVAAQL